MLDAPAYILRDFRSGRFAKKFVASFLIPDNSVSNSINVNFDEIIGNAKVRAGTTKLGATVASTRSPLGIAPFVGPLGTPNLLLVVFKGASNATLYYYNGSWNASNLTGLSNTAKVRFATLGGRAFATNTVDGMNSSTDGATWATGGNSIPTSVKPAFVRRFQGKLLAAGDPTFPDRVWFSSIIDPAASPFITWNVDTTIGDFIDINPDDNGNITGFSETSTYLIIFKDTGMYRLDVLSKTADPEAIFNIGAVSQEAITVCQGITYFYSGIDIRMTDGGYPEQISRTGVQDFLDAIPQANKAAVTVTNDGLNVRVFIGDVTLNTNQDNQVTYNNVCLKYSPRDQNWSVHSYADEFKMGVVYTDSTNGAMLRCADTDGDVQTIELGTTDNASAISYNLETQEIEAGNRAHEKQITNQLVAFMKFGQDGQLMIRAEDEDYKPIDLSLDGRVNIGDLPSVSGKFFTILWLGQVVSSQKAPILEGFYIEEIKDLGIVQ